MSSQATTRIIDVSVGLSPATPVWPGERQFEFVQKQDDLGGGEAMTYSRLRMSPHNGTHIDAPLHFVAGGKAIDAVSLDALIGPCRVFEHLGDRHITKGDLTAMGFVASKRVLFKTCNSRRFRNGELDKNFVSLLPDAMDFLISSKVEVLGIDGFSIGPYGELTTQNHIAFCRTGGIIIEMLDLTDVEPGEYGLIALPVKLEGIEAAPTRVVLIRTEDADILSR